jgi:hypothetical protein
MSKKVVRFNGDIELHLAEHEEDKEVWRTGSCATERYE